MNRGRLLTCMTRSRRPVEASRTVTLESDSPVTYTFAPSGLTDTPSGSFPTGTRKCVACPSTETAVAESSASFET